jgi:hypothetical protein
MSEDDKKRDRALQRRVRERQAKTGESYQAAWRQLTDQPPDDQSEPFSRVSTGLPDLDTVLGGGLISASVVLLTGATAAGKTSLTLQVLAGLGHQCLYVATEETREAVAAMAERIGAASDRVYVSAERNLAKILAHAQELRAQTVAIDTIQKIFCEDIHGEAGNPKQLVTSIDRVVHFAKTTDTAFWLVGHATKDGDIAGPRSIEHSVDVVLSLACGEDFDGTERIVRCRGKNRFGSTAAVGRFTLTPSGLVPVPDQNKTKRVPRNQRRIPLPVSTEERILPGQSAQITARPQVATFWPDRLLIKDTENWTIQQLTVERKDEPKHSLIETTDQAAAFAYDTWQPLAAREVLCGDAVVLAVTYRGDNAKGERFEGALFGWQDGLPAKAARRSSSSSSAERISERLESPQARPAETIRLPWTIASPSLFVDRVTIENAKDWIIEDIRTRGRSIFAQAGAVPAEMFSEAADVILEPLKEGDLVLILATYIGRESARLAVELSGTATPPTGPRALSYFLPVSTGVPILPAQSAQITARPQTTTFLPERVVIADAANWVINDLKVGNSSCFAQAGDVPAQAFDSRAVGSHVMLGPVRTAQDFIIVTTRVSSHDGSAPFFCGVQGRLAEDDEAPKRERSRSIDANKSASSYKPRLVMSLAPDAENPHRVGAPIPRILPKHKTRVVMRPIHGAFVIDNLHISNAGTPGGSADWVVNEIEIDGRSQHVPKDISGTLFGGSRARVSFTGLDVVERDREIAITVTYVGPNPEGVPLFAAITGSRPPQNPTVIPMAPRAPFPPTRTTTIRVSELSAPFQVERLIIEEGNTEGGSADWIVNDLRIGNRSQFVQSGNIPGDLFATNALDTFVKFDPSPAKASIEIDVTYIGLRKDGALFRAKLEGTVERDDYDAAPPDLSVLVETVGQGAGEVVIATCNFRPPATSYSAP